LNFTIKIKIRLNNTVTVIVKCYYNINMSVARGLIRGLIEGWSAEMSQSEDEVYEGYFLLRGRFFTISRGFAVWHVG
jgi:hypothetical protein